MSYTEKIVDGKVEEIQKNGKTVWSRKQEKQEIQAETIADLYDAGAVSDTALDKIQENKPDVHEKVMDKVNGG